MTDGETSKLEERIAELEEQIVELREEFEWDLKAARETSASTVQRLEEENARLNKAQPGGGPSDDLEAMTGRALKAERRVAELQVELKRAEEAALRSQGKDDSLLRQRAQSSEQERETLRREVRALERKQQELQTALDRAKERAGATREANQRVEELTRKLAEREREIKRLGATERDHSALGQADQNRLVAERDRLRTDLDESRQALQASQAKVRELADGLEATGQRKDERRALEARADGLQQELADVRARATEEHDQARGLRQRIEALEAELATARAQPVPEATGEPPPVEQKQAALQAEHDRLQTELDRARKDQARQQRTMADLLAASDEIAAEAQQASQQVVRLQAQLAELHASPPAGPVSAQGPTPPVTKPVTDPVAEPVPEPATEPAVEPAGEPARLSPADLEGLPDEQESAQLAEPDDVAVLVAPVERPDRETSRPRQTLSDLDDLPPPSRRAPPRMRPMRAVRARSPIGRWAFWALGLTALALVAWVGLRHGPTWFGGAETDPGEPGPAADSPPGAPAPAEPSAQPPGQDQPAADQPADDQPVAEQPAADQPADDQPADDEPADEPPDDPAPVKQPPAKQPPAKQPPAKQPPAKQPLAKPAVSPTPAAQQARKAEARQQLQAGEALMRKGNHQAAVVILEQALRLDPGLTRAHRDLGISYAQLKQNRRACDAYRRYRQRLPDGSKEIPALDQILAGCK